MARRLTPASLSTVSCSCFFSTHGGGGGAGSTASSSARLSSLDEPSSTVTAEQPNIKMHAVYVHHVTKVVLKHLQEHQSEWLIDHGLDRGLRLNANGTAILQFPSSSSSTGTTNGHSGTSSSVGSGRIWYVWRWSPTDTHPFTQHTCTYSHIFCFRLSPFLHTTTTMTTTKYMYTGHRLIVLPRNIGYVSSKANYEVVSYSRIQVVVVTMAIQRNHDHPLPNYMNPIYISDVWWMKWSEKYPRHHHPKGW